MKLGRLPVKHDPRTFQAAKYMEAVSPPPVSSDWDSPVPRWNMFKNDTIGDCTFAACGHLVQNWTFNATANEITISDTDIIKGYSAVSGYDPQTGANDNGCNELDVLNYVRKTGIAGHKFQAYVQLDVTNINQIKQAINLFGGVYIGINMPISAQSQVGGLWDAASGANGQPGSWGGHAIHVGKYNASEMEGVTWGDLQRISYAFWNKYVEEAYAIVSLDFFNGGKDPQGFDITTLENDLVAVGNNAPTPTPFPNPVPPTPTPTPTPVPVPPTPVPPVNGITVNISDQAVIDKTTKAAAKKGLSVDDYVTLRLAHYFHVQ